MPSKKLGRPLAESEHRSVAIKVWVTPTMAEQIEAARGTMKRSDWLRQKIKRGLR